MSKSAHILKKLKSCLYVCSGGIGVFSALNIYQENEKFYEQVLVPVSHLLNPETSHNFSILALKYNLLPRSRYKDPNSLNTKVWHLDFQNPIGIAAGFDKQGEAISSLHDIGFGFVEIGSITPLPQEGNAKPRVFRLPDNQAIINRYGFNSEGHDSVYERVSQLKNDPSFKGVLGINLGKNKTSADPSDDYTKGILKFGEVADYLVINISSPNTPGLRDWQKKEHLQNLLSKLVVARNSLSCDPKPPLLLKLAPDLTTQEKHDIAQVILDPKCRVDGLIISNTTVERSTDLTGPYSQESGGLSGRPLTLVSSNFIAEMYHLTKGEIPIIGVGGVFTGQDAFEKICAGASIIQLYTSFVYHGPPRIKRIKNELDDLLRINGFSSVSEAVGKRPFYRK
uniref:Dihydroorotate dehydrogenase (quinone), mitochondrial n=1 Tax=Clastoptera arizonana TaxID=38151 RepID=A0A1B6DRI4_9HEMI